MTNTQTIYVELLDEGVVVYRPVEATPDPTANFVFRRKRPPTSVARRNYQCEGSGAGKSSVYEELIRRGYKAISTDRAWAYHADPDTEAAWPRGSRIYAQAKSERRETGRSHRCGRYPAS